jgi:hypothetical protein
MRHHLGTKWYERKFDGDSGKLKIDFSPSYCRSQLAIRRISEQIPDAKIILCVRDRLTRSFSHYWHEKKKNRFDYNFEEVFHNYDLFSAWVGGSLYSLHIEKILRYFDRSQLLCIKFDNLKNNPDYFYKNVCKFLDIDTGHQPSVLNQKINQARPRAGKGMRHAADVLKGIGIYELIHDAYKWASEKSGTALRMEEIEDVDGEVIDQLADIFEDDRKKLEKLI